MQSKQQSTEKTSVDVWPNVSLTRAELRSKDTLTLMPECQSAQMSKITRDGLPVWHRMLYICTHMATVGIKGLSKIHLITPMTVDNTPDLDHMAVLLRWASSYLNTMTESWWQAL